MPAEKESVMAYVDGFVMPVPTKNLAAYRKLARLAGKIWREHGALEYRECVGDDFNSMSAVTFTKLLKLKKSEKAIFAWVVYKSRADRQRVLKKVMNDPRLAHDMVPKMPFDMKRVCSGGFKV